VTESVSIDVERFAVLAADYCDLLDVAETMSPVMLLHEVHRRLPLLYAAALQLPDVTLDTEGPPDFRDTDELEDDDDSDLAVTEPDENVGLISPEEWMRRFRALAKYIGKRNNYRSVFAPYELDNAASGFGNLADDLMDIYRDLQSGLLKWQRGERTEAAWEWQFHFGIHWGEHAISALRALYELSFSILLEPPLGPPLGPPPVRSDP
jgi:hypothetical protein